MQQTRKITEDMLFSKLPCHIKKELAMHLDCGSHQNWKHLAEALNCPVYQIMAFQERAVFSKEASPSLIFFDQFCDSICVEQFMKACYTIQNFSSAKIIENYMGSISGSIESLRGNSEILISELPKRMQDFENLSTGSHTSYQENIRVSLSTGICRNLFGVNTSDKQSEFCDCKVKNQVSKISRISSGPSQSSDKSFIASVFITYSPQDKIPKTILNICNFLKNGRISVSIDTDAKYLSEKPIEEWIKEKFESVDNIIIIATPRYKRKGRWSTCFLPTRKSNHEDDSDDGFHSSLIYSLMLAEHHRIKHETSQTRKRFVCLLPPGKTRKDIPKWLRSSYPVFIWPDDFHDFLFFLTKNVQRTSNQESGINNSDKF